MFNKNRVTAIIVFVRFPVEGKVKTRLANETDDEYATSFYKTCAEHTFNELLKVKENGTEIFLFCSEENEIHKVKRWTEDKFKYQFQQGDNLGLRMLNAFSFVFNKGYEKVIIVGTDAPDLSLSIIQNAIIFLNDYSCVIGPANDGGYYLLGFRKNVTDVFNGIEWSTETVFENTIEKLKYSKTDFFVMDELIDIDTKEDLSNWISRLENDSIHPVKIFFESNNRFFN
jgi:rSAM/selenodomain-associated transferase 1